MEELTALAARLAMSFTRSLHSATAKPGVTSRRSSGIRSTACFSPGLSGTRRQARVTSWFLNGRSMAVVAMLNTLWHRAMPLGVIASSMNGRPIIMSQMK